MKSRVSGAALLVVLASLAHAQDAPPPKLELQLKPHLTDGRVDYVAGELHLEAPKVTAGATLLRMPLIIVSIPTARYDGNAIAARDDTGALELKPEDETPTPTGTYRRWLAQRATSGDVHVSFKAPPRVVTSTTRTGPLFDLRSEGNGLFGAGITFLPLPDGEQPYHLKVKWDLSGMPAGSRAVTSFGDGDIDTMGPATRLAFTFYAAGPLKRYPATGSQDFGIYWLTDPPFDIAALSSGIRSLYQSMAKFFGDEGKPYRVFIRHNPHKDGGGTALPQSFMFGWNEASAPKTTNLQSLLSHEMAHNWPAMEGEHGDTAWYSEGAAEFYSLLLSYRAGVLTTNQFMAELNERAEGYYTNPYLNASNTAAADQFWKDWSAQRVPYGRGFMYLALVDAKIRAKSGGKRSLDDVVLAMYQRQTHEKPYGIPQWLGLVGAELGTATAQQDYEAMRSGKTLEPPSTSFSPCFRPASIEVRPYQLGFDQNALATEPKVIRGLVANSAAAKAGLREGDVVVANDDVLSVQRSEKSSLSITVRRDGKDVPITFVPRAEPVSGFHWERSAGVKDSQCRF
jgi:hypothetical protein